jgi:hypothetical protein
MHWSLFLFPNYAKKFIAKKSIEKAYFQSEIIFIEVHIDLFYTHFFSLSFYLFFNEHTNISILIEIDCLSSSKIKLPSKQGTHNTAIN